MELKKIAQDADNDFRNKNFESAINAYKLILEKIPTNPKVLSNIGNCYFKIGNSDEAIEYLNQAISYSNDAIYKIYLGQIYYKLDNLILAKKLYESALKSKNLHKKYIAFHTLGEINKRLSDVTNSIKCYESALAEKHDYVPSLVNLGNIYKEKKSSDYIKAEDFYLQAIKASPKLLSAYPHLMDFYEKTNQLAKLKELIIQAPQEVRHLKPFLLYEAIFFYRESSFKKSLNLLNKIGKIDNSKREFFQLESRRLNLIAKCNDKIENYSDAFIFFKKANDYYYSNQPNKNISKERFQNIISNRLEFYGSTMIDKKTTEMNSQEEPVFIIGFPRSGTTLIDNILSSHSSISCIEEKPFVRRMISRNSQDISDPNYIINTKNEEILKASKLYLDEVKKHSSNSRICIDRHPFNTVYIGDILFHFPKAKIIFMIRHPMDCVLSSYMQYFKLSSATAGLIDLEDTTNTYINMMKLWEICKEKFEMNFLEIKYEDLVNNFKDTTEISLDFLGCDWEESINNFYDRAKNKRINTASYDQVIKPIYNNSIGKWENYSVHLSPIESNLARWVKRFNY